jgi:hypothetical protein
VKIADFGISKRAEDGNGPSTVKGTLQFMAPELLFNSGQYLNSYNHQSSDIWALGGMTFRMLSGKHAFKHQGELFEYYQKRREFPTESLRALVGETGSQFVSSLMIVEPELRMNATDALFHPWITPHFVDPEDVAVDLTSDMLSSPIEQMRLSKEHDEEPTSLTSEASARWSTVSNARIMESNVYSKTAKPSPTTIIPRQEHSHPRRATRKTEDKISDNTLRTIKPTYLPVSHDGMDGESNSSNFLLSSGPSTHVATPAINTRRKRDPTVPTSPPLLPAVSISSPKEAITSPSPGVAQKSFSVWSTRGERDLVADSPSPPPPRDSFRVRGARGEREPIVYVPGPPGPPPPPRRSFSVRVARGEKDPVVDTPSLPRPRKSLNIRGAHRERDPIVDIPSPPPPRGSFSVQRTGDENKPSPAYASPHVTGSQRHQPELLTPPSTGGDRFPRRFMSLRRSTSVDRLMLSNLPEETDVEIVEEEYLHRIEEGSMKPMHLKGLLSVSTTSNKPLPVILADIIRVLGQLGIQYTDIKSGFSCEIKPGVPWKRWELRFEILIIKVPLLSLHGIQFKKVEGRMIHYKNIAQEILKGLKI